MSYKTTNQQPLRKTSSKINYSNNKKPKNEKVHATVDEYLKKKYYVAKEMSRRSEKVLHVNKQQFVFQKMLDTDTHDSNSFSYSNVICLGNNNHNIVDQQFSKLTEFVESHNDIEIRFELRRFYAPILCHLYIELLKANETKSAAKLLCKYAHLVAPRNVFENENNQRQSIDRMDSNKDIIKSINKKQQKLNKSEHLLEDYEAAYFHKLIQTLASTQCLEALDNCRTAVRFRSSKYEINTTQNAVNVLMMFLEKHGHVLMLQVISTWLHVHIFDHDVGQWAEDDIFTGGQEQEYLLNNKNKETTIALTRNTKCTTECSLLPSLLHVDSVSDTLTENEYRYRLRNHNVRTALKTMRETRGALLKNQIEFPHFFKIADKGRGVTSAHLCMNECHLLIGLNNSAISLWSLNQRRFNGKQLYRKPEDINCPWNINNCNPWSGKTVDLCEEDDDNIDCDIREDARANLWDDRRKRKIFYERKYEDNSYNEFGGIMLRGHSMGVTDVRFSAHYPLFFTTSKDRTWRSWRADSYNCAHIYRGHNYPIWCLDESPVGQYLATGSHDLTARLWALERNHPLITYVGHTQDIECVCFHPNGNYLATGSADLSVRLWDVSSGRLVRVFDGCKEPVAAITFSPDGKFLAAGGDESKVRIFDLAAGAQLADLKDHSASVSSVAWSGCGREVATVCNDGTLRLWDVKKVTPLVFGESDEYVPNTSTTHRLMAVNSGSCTKLLRVLYSRNETICCIGV